MPPTASFLKFPPVRLEGIPVHHVAGCRFPSESEPESPSITYLPFSSSFCKLFVCVKSKLQTPNKEAAAGVPFLRTAVSTRDEMSAGLRQEPTHAEAVIMAGRVHGSSKPRWAKKSNVGYKQAHIQENLSPATLDIECSTLATTSCRRG